MEAKYYTSSNNCIHSCPAVSILNKRKVQNLIFREEKELPISAQKIITEVTWNICPLNIPSKINNYFYRKEVVEYYYVKGLGYFYPKFTEKTYGSKEYVFETYLFASEDLFDLYRKKFDMVVKNFSR